MDELAQIIRQTGRQQAHNAYYRNCYVLFKVAQDLTEQTVKDLQTLYQSDRAHSSYSVHQILWKLQNGICSLIERAGEAQSECEELCPVDASCSAREILEPIRRMYTDPDVATPARGGA